MLTEFSLKIKYKGFFSGNLTLFQPLGLWYDIPVLKAFQKKRLEEILAPAWTTSDPADLACYGYDATRIESLPDIVMRPSTAAEIAGILRFASAEEIPVVPRGMGSGFAGGSVPVRGGILLSLERMNRIQEIDEENLTAVVEPGVVTAELHRRAREKGLYYPPDPSSSEFCTIGGNIAQGASGPHSVKYGGTKDYLLGLELVTPTEEILRAGGRTVKRAVGYDLVRLIVGSEGTLAVVTRAILKLIPYPECRVGLLALFPSIYDASRAITEIVRSKASPSVLEYMDEASLGIMDAHSRFGLPAETRSILMIETDGSKSSASEEAEWISALCYQSRALRVDFARTEEETARIWKARKALSQTLYRIKPAKINEDIVVPRSKVGEMVSGLADLGKKYGLTIVSFGHAGEGNLHVNIMTDQKGSQEWDRAQEAVAEIFRLALSLGGSLSGEHGIGLSKRPYFSLEVDSVAVKMMKEVKRAFDPKGILNPGKIFPEIL